jgi:hypothetical protein
MEMISISGDNFVARQLQALLGEPAHDTTTAFARAQAHIA